MQKLIKEKQYKLLFEYIRDTEGEYLPLQFIAQTGKSNITNIQPEPVELTEQETEFINIENWEKSSTMEELHLAIKDCQKCKYGTTRTKFVFGVGNTNAEILLVGEAPGADEDLKGEPFVGKAGQLLDKILAAINLDRNTVYIANVVKCRPPGNKTPDEADYSPCLPYLKKQIELIKPKFILLLGAVALQALFGKSYKITNWRGKVINYGDIIAIPTYHPAYLLRNPAAKKEVWEDVQFLQKLYLENKQTNKEL